MSPYHDHIAAEIATIRRINQGVLRCQRIWLHYGIRVCIDLPNHPGRCRYLDGQGQIVTVPDRAIPQ